MSWLNDLAGQAEKLLTKIDQNAAEILQSESDDDAGTSPSSNEKVETAQQVETKGNGIVPPLLETTAAWTGGPPQSARELSATPEKRKSHPSGQSVDEDHLIEFLNSPTSRRVEERNGRSTESLRSEGAEAPCMEDGLLRRRPSSRTDADGCHLLPSGDELGDETEVRMEDGDQKDEGRRILGDDTIEIFPEEKETTSPSPVVFEGGGGTSLQSEREQSYEEVAELKIADKVEQNADQSKRASDDAKDQIISNLEVERRTLLCRTESLAAECSRQKIRESELSRATKAMRQEMSSAAATHDEYKAKARRVLAEKDATIAGLKEGGDLSDTTRGDDEQHFERERCLLLAQVTELRTALHSEKLGRQEVEAEFAEMAERAEREANEAASKAEARAAELKRELKRTMEDLSYAKDELARCKTNFSVDISGREADIEALRWEVTSLKEKKAIESDGQPPSTPNADEKVQSLTAMLLQRQSMLEAAVTEKNSMALQLEREKTSAQIAESKDVQRQRDIVLELGIDGIFDSKDSVGAARSARRIAAAVDRSIVVPMWTYAQRMRPSHRLAAFSYLFVIHFLILVLLL